VPELRLAAIDLVPVVHSAIETSRPLIESKHHELTVDLPAHHLARRRRGAFILRWPIF
jgi:hypothetical protein